VPTLRAAQTANDGNYFTDQSQAIGMAEVMIPATSRLIGKTVVTAGFRTAYDLAVIGLKRGQTAHEGSVLEERLRLGDTLLVVGPWRAIRKLQSERRDLIVLNVPAELEDVVAMPRAPLMQP
jgi:di/tricarboxylate transporter